MKTAEELISEIYRVQDELERLEVKREKKNFKAMSLEDLEDFLETVGDQLQARKRWMEGRNNGKN